MNENILSHYTVTNFKRKRKPDVKELRYGNLLNAEGNHKKCKRTKIKDSQKSRSDSSSSTTPLYSTHLNNNIKREKELSISDSLSSDECSSIISKNTTPSVKMEPRSYQGGLTAVKSELIDRNTDYDQDTFCVDMGRYHSFTTSSRSTSNFLNTDFLSFDSPLTKIEAPSSPMRVQRNRRNRNHVFRPHRHNKNVTVALVPCKGPACKSQICCAQFCSQRCYTNQMRPIGTGCLKNSMLDYDTAHQQEINVTDYGLPYPDHTYCRDHKNIYFSTDLSIDSPPYCDLVEKLFYAEKEQRIKNPRPEPNINGDPISSNGYVSQTGKRGRPKRSNVIGLLDQYIFHPSTDVVYTPFLFKESIIKADRLSNQIRNDRPVKDAIRQCTNLYKDVRADVPQEVLYPGHGCPPSLPHSAGDLLARSSNDDRIAVHREEHNSAIDDLFAQDDDDDDDEDDIDDDDDFSLQ